VEAHGSFFTAHCTNSECHKEYHHLDIKDAIMRGSVPRCEACGWLVKPDITFFGEALPQRFSQLVQHDFPQCDLLIVIGTSLQVRPFNELIEWVPTTTPRLLINREEVGKKNFISTTKPIDPRVSSGGSGGFRFGECDNHRDAQFLGDCESGILLLAKLLGWQEELEQMMAKAKNTPNQNQEQANKKHFQEEKESYHRESFWFNVSTCCNDEENADDNDERASEPNENETCSIEMDVQEHYSNEDKESGPEMDE
jgi:NAD-dependent deacetylase sirtuin 2